MTTIHIFDAYGTLLNVHAPASKVLDFTREDVKRFSEIWRAKQLEYSWVYGLMGEHAYKDFWQLTIEALDYALKAVPTITGDKRDALLKAYDKLEAYEDVKPYLNRLKETGDQAAILSNGSPKMLAAAVSAAGLDDLLDKVISVDPLKTFKTSPKVYQYALDQFGCEKDQIRFYSSNRWDVAGASAFGLETIWVNRTDRPDEYKDQPAGEVIRGFFPSSS